MSVMVSLPDECERDSHFRRKRQGACSAAATGLEDVVNTRRAAFRITVSEAQGIKIPDKALHRDENGTFVYVLRAGHCRALQGRVIQACEGYCLAKEAEIRENMQIVSD